MPRARANSLEIEYDVFGAANDPAFLLIMGFTLQKQAWDDRFCQTLADRGYRVVRFDNRDVGLSTRIENGGSPNVPAILMGDYSSVAYRLEDMARDSLGLLDALDIDRAHVVGVSMGGMIAQCMAIASPERILSLTSMMSTTGDRSVGQPTPEALGVLFAPPPVQREKYVEHAVNIARVIGSKSLPTPEHVVRTRAGFAYDRAFYPIGSARQFGAIASAGDRTEALRRIRIPTLVVHGREDPLIAPDGGEATARAIPGARWVLMEKMGHDLPEPLWPEIVALLDDHARAADPRGVSGT